MDLTRLRYFLAVVDTGHVGRAAELLHISQPALSKAVRLLESEAGIPLVARDGRGIAITPEGRELARRARPLVAELGELTHDLATGRATPRPLRYGSHETFGTAFAARVAELHDGMGIEHRYLGPEQIVESLAAGDIDVGVSYIPVLADGIDVAEAERLPISIWAPRALANQPFDELPFAAPARAVVGTAVRPQGVDAWPDESVARRVRYRVTHTQTALELCRSGLAVAFLADFLVGMFDRFAPARARLVRVPMPPPLADDFRQPVYLLTRTGEHPAGVDALRATLADVAPAATR